MNAEPACEEWRPSTASRIVSAFAGLVCGVFVITLGIGVATAGTGADLSGAFILATLFAAIAIVNLVYAFRLRLAIGPDGLSVRNFRTTRIPWSEFRDCSAGVWGVWIRRATHRPVIALAVDKAPVTWLSGRTQADSVVTAIDHYAQLLAA